MTASPEPLRLLRGITVWLMLLWMPRVLATWRWSAADRLFLKLIREAHRRKMRIIIDGVFNHTGTTFWALQQARREGPSSRFARWFHITPLG